MTTKIENLPSTLKRRIRQFYDLLNQREFERCYRMIDPHVRMKPSSVTLFQYVNALSQFLECVGSVNILNVEVNLHVGEPNRLYEDRDFALGKSSWEDEAGEKGTFLERWVRDGRVWYTRSTGFIVQASSKIMIPLIRHEKSPIYPVSHKPKRRVKPG